MTVYIVDGSASMGQHKDELKETLRLHGVERFFLAKSNGLSLLEVHQVDSIKFDSGWPLEAIERWLKALDLPYPENVMFITDESPEYQIKGMTERDPDSPVGPLNWLDITYKPVDTAIQHLSAAAAGLRTAMEGGSNDEEHEAAQDLLGHVEEFLSKHEQHPYATAEVIEKWPDGEIEGTSMLDYEETMHDDEFPDEHQHWPDKPYNTSFHVEDDEGRHYLLSINLTQEAMILDLYDRYGEDNLASWARDWDEIGEMVYEQDPSNINDPTVPDDLYEVHVRARFQATSPEDAVLQMAGWLDSSANTAGYRVECPDGTSQFIDAELIDMGE